jgi:sugar phosphate permease
MRTPSFWALALGSATASMAGYALFYWTPSFLVRSFGVGLADASRAFGFLVLVGGFSGMWLGGVLGDRLGAHRKSAYALVPACAFLAAVPFYVAGALAQSLPACMAILLVPTALGLVWLGPITSAVQHLVPPEMRTTASAIFLFINNLIGLGIGTTLPGVVSDALHARFGAEALRYAIVADTGLYLIAAAILFWGSRRLERDWRR